MAKKKKASQEPAAVEKKTRRTPAELVVAYREKAIEATARAAAKFAKGRVRRTPEEMVAYWTAKADEAQRRADADPLDNMILRFGRKAKKLHDALVEAGYCPEVSARLGDLVQAIEETL